MHWSGGILGGCDRREKPYPLLVAARFLPSMVEGSGRPRLVSHERQENERFPGGLAKPAGCDQTPHGNPLRK